MLLTGRHHAGSRFPICLLAAALTVGCTDVLPGPSNPGPTPPSFYLNGLLDLVQSNSIKRLTMDWPAFRRQVERDAAGASTIPDLYPAIRTALTLLGDGHSSYEPAGGGMRIYVPNRTCASPDAVPPSLPQTIGYVKVTAFSGSGTDATAFAQSIQSAIAAADRDDLIGWIVDLRGNSGGNMWPMVAGLGPILGETLLGYFIDPIGNEQLWEYRGGASILGGTTQTRVAPPYRLRRPSPKVAVLVDNRVASSGEATLVSFRQRPDTRSFGEPTCGLSTVNSSFQLSDGARLILTVSVLADRTKTRYGDSIAPDETISDPQQVVTRAAAWLQQQD